MQVGERIRALRKERGFSLKEVHNRTNISISFISDIENGRSNPSLEALLVLARGLGTSAGFLLGEDGAESVPQKPHLDEGLWELFADPSSKYVLEELRDFHAWAEEDREELLSYLKAKRLIRGK